MPANVRFIRCCLFAVLVCSSAVARAEETDRYASWRREQMPQPVVDEDAPAASVDEALSAAPADSGQSPPTRRRKLPVRFERSAEHVNRSRVIRASATEPVGDKPQHLSKPTDAKPLGLKRQSTTTASHRSSVNVPPVLTLVGSLAIVVGLFLIVAWATRRGMPKPVPTLPREAVEVLGRQRFAGKQEVQLVRVGNKLILVNILVGGSETLTEITDPAEVDRLTGLCYQAHPNSSSAGFRQVFGQLGREKSRGRKAVVPRSLEDVELAFSRNQFDD